jgi:hypothetical protein
VNQLPSDFPHTAPKGFSYEIKQHKPNIIGIWIRNHALFSYSEDVKSIWGFYNIKKRCYIAPITHKRPGKIVSLDRTSAYSAMPLLKLALDSIDDTPSPAIIKTSTKENMTKSLFVSQEEQVTSRVDILVEALEKNYSGRNADSSRPVTFTVQTGRKYLKINQDHGGVHAFINRKTGDVFKPASWAAPAKHVRYNLLDEKSFTDCITRADWAGGYLYMR